MSIIVRVGALVKARIDYWVHRVFVWFGGVLFGLFAWVFFPKSVVKLPLIFITVDLLKKIISKEHVCIHFSFSTVML